MGEDEGRLPRSGWAPMVCELDVADLGRSKAFWVGVLGFGLAYERPEEGFAYLEHSRGHQVVLRESGPDTRGAGVMFQLYFDDLSLLLGALATHDWPLERPLATVWRRLGRWETGQEEVRLRDPDGYLLLLARNFGARDRSTKGEHA